MPALLRTRKTACMHNQRTTPSRILTRKKMLVGTCDLVDSTLAFLITALSSSSDGPGGSVVVYWPSCVAHAQRNEISRPNTPTRLRVPMHTSPDFQGEPKCCASITFMIPRLRTNQRKSIERFNVQVSSFCAAFVACKCMLRTDHIPVVSLC